MAKCRDLINLANMKNNKIINVCENFQGSIKTIHYVIVAILAHTLKHKPDTGPNQNKDKDWSSKFIQRGSPPFFTHYRYADKIKWKLGDKKNQNGSTFFFYDCTLYRDKLKCHTHHTGKCHIHAKGLKDKGVTEAPPTNPTSILIKEMMHTIPRH